MKKQLGTFLLVLALLFTTASPALAANSGDGMHLTAEWADGTTTVVVSIANRPGVTNGRFTVTYSSSTVTLASVEPGSDAWMTSVNAEEEGEVSFAWINSELTADETVMLTLTFTDIGTPVATTVRYAVTCDDLYANGTVVELSKTEAQAADTVDYSGGSTPVLPPVEPSTQPSEPPVEPTEPPVTSEFPFVDVPEDDWAYEAVEKVYNAGLVAGTSETTYSPSASLTRAMFATVLYRAAGEPETAGTNPFVDATGSWYQDAVIWAYGNGVVNGTSATTFEPDTEITREQIAVMLYGYAEQLGKDTSARADLSAFSDADEVSSWAKEAMEWATATKVFLGGDGKLMPGDVATRAQMASILVRFLGL